MVHAKYFNQRVFNVSSKQAKKIQRQSPHLRRNGYQRVKCELAAAVLLLAQKVEQGAVAHVLGDDVEGLLFRAHRVHGHEVRVRKLFHDLSFLK